jgi:hypothetical protein
VPEAACTINLDLAENTGPNRNLLKIVCKERNVNQSDDENFIYEARREHLFFNLTEMSRAILSAWKSYGS